MPLEPGASKQSIVDRIKQLKGEGRPQKQAVAISLDVARKANAYRVPKKGK